MSACYNADVQVAQRREKGAVVSVKLAVVGVDLLAVACLIGGGYLAVGYLHPEPAQTKVTTPIDRNSQVWRDLEQRRDQLQRDLQRQGPTAPTPAPTTHDNTERSV